MSDYPPPPPGGPDPSETVWSAPPPPGGEPPPEPDPAAQAPPPAPGYTPPAAPGYPPPQQGYAPPQPGYAPPQPGYAPQPAYSAPMAVGADGRPLKSKMTAGLLGIFLGSIGVHRFYLGYTGIGVAQIFVTLFTCGIGGIWGLIEGILILTGSPSLSTDAEGRPLAE